MRTKRIRGRRHTRYDEGHDLCLTIGEMARAAAAPGWSRLAVHHAQVGAHARTRLTCDGRELAAEGLNEPFRRLRELSYRAGDGTWFTCELEYTPGSRAYHGRVDAAGPPFADVPPAAALVELTAFPRAEPPGWLLDALPTAAPLGLPVTYGERYDRLHSHRGGQEPGPLLPIGGELAYRPPSALTARVLEHRQRVGEHLLYLGERDGDRKAGHLLVLRRGAEWFVSRADQDTTGDGVRAITLDGAVLRLELTPEAADDLGTEAGYEVLLDLPPATVDELRTVLPGVLRPVRDHPELTGF
ncbi:hypothetical protein [Nonomuraea sp. NPDC049725]|uniref:hypothetical protein n=1 Tax=Nonomuraea sp. NPDC049725 TaxID=3154508 RepID=UPI0034301634